MKTDFRFSVECPGIPNDGKCHHRGKSYNVGDEIPESDHPKCKAACRCLNMSDNIDFNCANIECPELFRRPPASCVRQEVSGKCCAKYECGNTYFFYQLNFVLYKPICSIGNGRF